MKIQSIKKLAVLGLIITAFMSCNNGPTLQTYYVDNEAKPGFSTYDIPTSLINVENIELTKQQEKAYKSVDKINVLAFQINETNKTQFETELANVHTILQAEKYEDLMSGGNTTDGTFTVKMIGDVDSIDELIIVANANDKGFLVARVLGDDMNVSDIMSLQTVLDKVNFDDTDLGGLTDFFK